MDLSAEQVRQDKDGVEGLNSVEEGKDGLRVGAVLKTFHF